jgi:hypothetical protein
MAGATIIPFPQARRLGRPVLSTDDLRTIEAYYDAQGGQGAWRGFAPIGVVAVVLFTSYDRCPSLTLRRDSLGWYELAAPDGVVLRRGRSIEQVLRLFARAMNVG